MGYRLPNGAAIYGSEEVRQERKGMRLSKECLPPDLGAEALEQLRDFFLSKGYVQRAYIAVKKLEISGAYPQYVVLVKVRRNKQSKLQEVFEELMAILPGEVMLIPIVRQTRTLEYYFSTISYTRVV